MRRRHSRGFTYLGLMILLTIIGLVGAASLKVGSLLQRAAAEEELLEIGAQFSQALRSYADATPQGQLQQPPNLQALLKDPRFPNPRRHLRKIFVDPVTGKAEWGIMYFGDKAGVIGVYSLSTRRPLKIANFDSRFVNMDNRPHISDWKFLRAGGDLVNVVNPGQKLPVRGTFPGTLFRPGALPNDARTPIGPGLGGNMPIQPPPQPAPVQDTPVEPARPDEGQPMEAPPQEEKEKEKEKENEKEKEAEKEKEKDAEEQPAQDDASGQPADPEVTPAPQPPR